MKQADVKIVFCQGQDKRISMAFHKENNTDQVSLFKKMLFALLPIINDKLVNEVLQGCLVN